jgi:hypothetical protein
LEDSYTNEEIEKIKKWSNDKCIDSKVLSKILDAYLTIGVSYLPQIPLEIAIIEIINHD